MSSPPDYDIVIAGGGINGCGIARDAAMRGLKVLLCEAKDLASATSSASSKLIHGGLRYLEHREFRLVREALQERECLLRIAPHVIWPLRFILPHVPSMRPAWMIRLGLVMYDQLARRDVLPKSTGYQLTGRVEGENLTNPGYAFEYSDCWVDDARFVVLNALDAKKYGATILTNTKLTAATPVENNWHVKLSGTHAQEVRCKLLINATGPWAATTKTMLSEKHDQTSKATTRLVQGSHIVVPALFAHDKAYILQNHDRRIVFAIPYQDKFTLVGTTDRNFEQPPDEVAISTAETAYLLKVIEQNFTTKVTEKDIVWSYSGVRGLYDDGTAAAQEVTRDYVIKSASTPAPQINIYGGKLTTYRRLAKNVVDVARQWCPTATPCSTGTTNLPGGDFAMDDFANLVTELKGKCAELPATTAHRLARAYGTLALQLLDGAKNFTDLGQDFGAGLTQKEVDYLRDEEWATTTEDILWRRTKLGLHINAPQQQQLATYLNS